MTTSPTNPTNSTNPTNLELEERLAKLERRHYKLETQFYKLVELTKSVSENVVELTYLLQALRREVYGEAPEVPTGSESGSEE